MVIGPLQTPLLERALAQFVDRIVDAVPLVLSGLLFLAVAYVVVRLVGVVLEFALARALPGESPVYRQFVRTVVSVFLWFAVGLTFLSIVGLEDIAASLGTAAGFVALGVAYASSNMIADAVAGVYLLRDPDFSTGDTVQVGNLEGVVRSIELRKTRFDVGDDRVVRGNASIEKEWTRRAE